MGGTVSTILRIRNLSNSDVRAIYAYEVDGFDFGQTLRPDKQFDGVPLPAHSCLERSIEVKTAAKNCPFTMKLIYGDDTEDVFRIHYKYAYDETDPHFQHLTQTHRVGYTKKAPRVLELVIEDTEEQVENHRAEELNEEGCRLMASGDYDEAAARLMDASRKANKDATLTAIYANYEKVKELKGRVACDDTATYFNDEGVRLLNANKFDDALTHFRQGLSAATNPDLIRALENNLKTAKLAKTNRDAKKLNQEGLQLRRSDDNDGALLKFEEALDLATDAQLVASIKLHKVETLHNLGNQAVANAWRLEAEAPDESIDEFCKAKYLFQLADSVKTSPECADSVVMIDCKIEGCKCFDRGVQLEGEARRVSKGGNEAKSKFQDAWKQYKAALEKFELGLRKGGTNFERSVFATNQALERVEDELNGLGV